MADDFIDLETRLADPYSVELNYFENGRKLYTDPAEGRRWLAYLREDPNVRVRFGDDIYLLNAVLAGKPGEVPGFDAHRFVYRLEARNP